MPAILIIMAKQPSPGGVKTRLCPPLSAEQALALYQAFLHDTIALVGAACALAPEITPALAYAPVTAREYFQAIVPPNFVLLPQQGADLGERLAHLPFQARELGYSACAMIDSDSPTLPPTYLLQGFAALAQGDVDVVLGPCADGGYYFIGLTGPQPALFSGIPWSTDGVTAATIDAAERSGHRVLLLPQWYDADTAADLDTLRAELQDNPTVAPHSRAALALIDQPQPAGAPV